MILGINGGYGSGKSTAVEALQGLGRKVVLVKFAGPLYEIQSFIYGRIAPAYKPPEGFVKDRTLLQWLGTEFGRKLKESLWVDLWKAEVERVLAIDSEAIVVSDDTRFDNEAEAVRSMGGKVFKVHREAADLHAVGGTGIKGHASEAGISPALVDLHVHNDGSREEFQMAFRSAYMAAFEGHGC